MGLYDRDYLQDDYGSPRRVPSSARTMVINLVILNVGIYLLQIFLTGGAQTGYWVLDVLRVTPDVLFKPWLWWKFLTYGFAHAPPPDLGHVFWNMFGLWVFGRDVESIYGPKEFLRIYLTAIVLGGIFWCARESFAATNSYLIGASGAVTAITLLFVLHYPKRTILLMFVLPVPAWAVGLLVIGGNIMMLLQSGGDMSVAVDVHLVGAAFAIAYYRFGWNLGRVIPSPAWLRFGAPKFKLKRQPKLRVHDPDADDRYREQDDEADRILDKVNREGMDSLSRKERRMLEEYSRRMRQKHR